MRKLAALGTALVMAGGVAGATPAQAQIGCSQPIAPVCSAAMRQLQHVMDEVGRVPGYIAHVEQLAYQLYDEADATVRCVVFKECT